RGGRLVHRDRAGGHGVPAARWRGNHHAAYLAVPRRARRAGPTSMTPTLSVSALLVVALGGALGSVARYAAGVWLLPVGDGFPVGTLTVNVIGAFLIGCFARLALTTE